MRYQRVIISKFGGRDALQIIGDETGELKPGYVRVRVQAAGVAWADVMMRTGLYPGKIPDPPFTPGYDIAGTVIESAFDQTSFQPGDFVAAIIKIGGYSEVVDVKADLLVPVPSGVDPAQVACLPLNYLAAYQMLHRFADAQPGEKVLIHGAAGGVGTAFLQLGKLTQLEMLGTESLKKHELVRSLGGTPIDYQVDDFTKKVREKFPQGVDAIFDPIGGSHLVRSYTALAPGGRLIAYGERAIVGEGVHNPQEAKIHNDFMSAHKDPSDGKSVQWYETIDQVMKHPEWYQGDMRTLLDLLAEKKISPLIAERFPYQDVQHAHELLEASAVVGKLVLIF